MFVPLLSGHFFGSSDDNRITMSRRKSLVPFSCTVVVPYERVWIVGSCLFFFNLRLFHDELVERVRIPFFLPLLFSIPVDPVRCGLSLFVCSVFVALFYSIPPIPVVTMASGLKEVEPRVSCRLLALPCSSPCMLVPCGP
jgi:hypothetical protein